MIRPSPASLLARCAAVCGAYNVLQLPALLLRGLQVTVLLAATAAARAEEPPVYVLLGQPAPDFTLHAALGANVRLSEHRGEVAVVSFWGSHCNVCRAQLAALDRSLGTYASAGLLVCGVSVDDDSNQAREFARSTGVRFPLLLDPRKDVARSYQVDNLPLTVLIDRSGVVRYVLRDYSQASEQLYLQRLRALLNE